MSLKRMISALLVIVTVIAMFVICAPAASAALYNSSSPVPSFSKIEVTDGAVRFTWNKITNSNCKNGVFYRVYYKNAKGSWTRMITTAATHFVDTDVHVGKTFTYTIRCVSPETGEFASDYNHTGWKATYYEAPVITSMVSEPENEGMAGTGSEEPTQAAQPTEATAPTDAPEPTAAPETTVVDADENEVEETADTPIRPKRPRSSRRQKPSKPRMTPTSGRMRKTSPRPVLV